MGSGASAGLSAAIGAASDAELAATLAELPIQSHKKVVEALSKPLVQRSPSAAEVLHSIHSGKKSCVAIVKGIFERIQSVNGELNACVEVFEKSALESAAAVDAKVASGSKLEQLEGLPLLVKANIDVAATLTTAATPALKNWRPRVSAPCAQKLLDKGAILIAKTNLPEFAMRMDGWSYVHGLCRNPHSLQHSTGGSSSGTAVAIAAGIAPVGLGTDTSGSIRIPAACCGVTGFRPSRGRWPCAGVFPIDSRRDTPGPMGGSVADVALLDAAVTGEEQVQPADLNGVQVSVPQDWLDALAEKGALEDALRQGLDQAAATLKKAGATVDNKPDFFKVVDMLPIMGSMDTAQDIESYLSLHADRPEEISAAKIAELTENDGIRSLVLASSDEAKKAKMAEVDAEIERTEQSYREYFKKHGLQAILMPCIEKEPLSQSPDKPTPFMEMFRVPSIVGRLTQIKCPSIALSTTTKHIVGGGSLPVSVLLLGIDDRQLLSIALSLEQAFVASSEKS